MVPVAESTLDRLSLATLDRLPSALRPTLEPRDLSVGIVHLGVGAFHRAHQVVYTEAACELTGELNWGICGVSERSPAAAATLAAQDGLYSVLVAGPKAPAVQVMVSLRQAMFAQAGPEALTARIADRAVKVITLTVSEKGYRYDPTTRRLSGQDHEVDADAAGRPPTTVLGQLARGLEARRRLGSGPLTIISCDNITANGRLLQGLVEEMISRPTARFDAGLPGWVADNVSFPSTMVDRIVPATTGRWRDEVAGLIGLADQAAVVTEPFRQWVIEDRFAAGRPAWDRAGAQVVADVAPYEALKLRALNGTHSALAYLGLLAGCETISEALARPGFEAFAHAMLDDEVRPTLALPEGVDFASYRGSVLERFANASLPYRCLQVATDGSQKLPQRVLGVVRERLRTGHTPRFATLVVAAWLRSIWTGVDDVGRPFELSDPITGKLRDAIGGTDDIGVAVDQALKLQEVFGPDLGEEQRFRSALKEAVTALARAGTDSAVAAMTTPG